MRFLHANWKSTSLENALEHQPACKPGSVGHRPACRETIRDGHSSGTMFAHCLEQPTRTASLTSLPRRYRFRERSACAVPIRFCSRWGLPCRLRCRSRGALLPHLFTLTRLAACAATARQARGLAAPEPRRGGGGRFVLCGTFPKVTLAGRYPAPYVKGARTFLPGGLSTPAGAAVRPTDGLRMGHL